MLHSIPGGRSPQTPIPAPSPDDLTHALEDTERMASILHTLLADRMISTGVNNSIAVDGQDADNIRFAAGQLSLRLVQAFGIWRAMP